MISSVFYPLLLCLCSGCAIGVLVVAGVYLLRHRDYQFRWVFAVVLLMLAVGFFNNFLVLVCRNLHNAVFLNTLLLLYDYMVVGGLMAFCVSLVFPGRYSAWRLSVLAAPYAAALLVFAISRSPVVYPAVQLYTLVASTALLLWLWLSIRRHRRMLLDNVGNLEYFDLRWGAILIGVLYAVQLVWAVESLSQQSWFTSTAADSNLLLDTLWCFITVAYVLLVVRKIMRQQVFVVAPLEDIETRCFTLPHTYYKTLDGSNIDEVVRENRYYLDATLTLQALATHLGTNRQYLSNYINRERHKTFYEYINGFRLEEARQLLDSGQVERWQTMEGLASMVGFNSYATFLRQWVKRYGVTPSEYLKRSGQKS